MKIFLNPGHCIGQDPGACGFGLQEAEVAMNIAKLTAYYLNLIHYDTNIYSFDGLAEIVDVANYWDPDVFVSIHCNAFDGNARGTETFYSYDDGQFLAECIQYRIINAVPTLDRGVSPAQFYVIKNSLAPACLVETAFIDNFLDNQLLSNYQEQFARAIACGITDFFVYND